MALYHNDMSNGAGLALLARAAQTETQRNAACMQQISQTLLCGPFIDAVKRTAARIKLRGMSVGSTCNRERAVQYMLLRTAAVCVKVTHSISLTLPTVFA